MLPSPAPVVPLATVPRSIIITFSPAFVSESAAQAPTIPAPMTIASGVFADLLISLEPFEELPRVLHQLLP